MRVNEVFLNSNNKQEKIKYIYTKKLLKKSQKYPTKLDHFFTGVNVGYVENSYSNSNNGGSVNSQDSLWQLKMGGNGSTGGGTHISRDDNLHMTDRMNTMNHYGNFYILIKILISYMYT